MILVRGKPGGGGVTCGFTGRERGGIKKERESKRERKSAREIGREGGDKEKETGRRKKKKKKTRKRQTYIQRENLNLFLFYKKF